MVLISVSPLITNILFVPGLSPPPPTPVVNTKIDLEVPHMRKNDSF